MSLPVEKETAAVSSPSRPCAKRAKQRPALTDALSTNSMFFGIPTTDDTKEHCEEEHGEHSWRYKIVAFLHTPGVQKTISALLVGDILLLFLELFLLATFPHCSIIERDGLSCTLATETDTATDTHDDEDHSDGRRWLLSSFHRMLSGGDDEHGDGYEICEPGYDWNGIGAGCDESKWSTVHTVEKYVFALTVFILSVFLLELTVEMIALTPQVFFRQFWFLLDYAIITISLALEISFRIKQEEIFQSFAGVLVVVRIWRFVRIGHGIVEVTHENVNHQGKELLLYVEELEGMLKNNGISLPGSAKRIHEVHHDHAAHLLETIAERDHSKMPRDAAVPEEDESSAGGDEANAGEVTL